MSVMSVCGDLASNSSHTKLGKVHAEKGGTSSRRRLPVPQGRLLKIIKGPDMAFTNLWSVGIFNLPRKGNPSRGEDAKPRVSRLGDSRAAERRIHIISIST
jgi:hypothetical protein